MRVWFASFWGKFDVYDNVFTYALSQKYDVEVTPDNPDLVITNDFRKDIKMLKWFILAVNHSMILEFKTMH